MLSFKKIFNESPDHVRASNLLLHWTDEDTVTFMVTPELWIFSDGYQITHADIFQSIINQNIWKSNNKKQWSFKGHQSRLIADAYSKGNWNKLTNVFAQAQEKGLTKYLTNRSYFMNFYSQNNSNEEILVGRYWKGKNICSLWNAIDEINPAEIQSLFKFIESVQGNLETLKIEISGYMYSAQELTKTGTPEFKTRWSSSETHKLDPAQMHTMSPELKRKYLERIGAKPKVQNVSFKDRYLKGESVVHESPDRVVIPDPDDDDPFQDNEAGFWDGFTFYSHRNFLALQKNKSERFTHQDLSTVIVDYMKENPENLQTETPVELKDHDTYILLKGNLSFLKDDISIFGKARFNHSTLKYFLDHHILMGRVWPKYKIVSFWNPVKYLNEKDLDLAANLLQTYYNLDPQTMIWDIRMSDEQWTTILSELSNEDLAILPSKRLHESNFVSLTFSVLKKIVTNTHIDIKKQKEKQKKEQEEDIKLLRDLGLQPHTISPELKGQVLKQQGAVPKKPLDIRDKFLRGESFKTIFKMVQESPDQLGDIDFTQGLTFIYTPNYQAWSNKAHDTHIHWTFADKLQSLYEQKKHKKEDMTSPLKLTLPVSNVYSEWGNFHFEGDLPLAVAQLQDGNRSKIIRRQGSDLIILGRYFPQIKTVSLWNPAEYLNKNIILSLREFIHEKYNAPLTVKFEVPIIKGRKEDLDDMFLEELPFHTFSTHALINFVEKNPLSSRKEIQAQSNIHTLSPEIKGQVMKQQGIKPKIPLDFKDKYLRGESFHYIFQTIEESPDHIYRDADTIVDYQDGLSYSGYFFPGKNWWILGKDEPNDGGHHILRRKIQDQDTTLLSNYDYREDNSYFLARLPDAIQMRLFHLDKVFTKWGPITEYTPEFKKAIVDMIQGLNQDPKEWQFEIPDKDNNKYILLSWEEFENLNPGKASEIKPTPSAQLLQIKKYNLDRKLQGD